MATELYPLLLEPVYKDYMWGGNRIAEIFARANTPSICAESWEVSDRPEGMSIVSNGPLKDTPLRELMETVSAEITGNPALSTFPLLTKIIDARKRLSVQVHPNDDNAQECGGEAKTECWYVLDAEPGSIVFAGVRSDMTQESFQQGIDTKSLSGTLTALPVTQGDLIYIPGGRVHAIAEGCLLLEVQQNSNTTYRVYDWDRLDATGASRELHIEKAFQVIDWNDSDDPIIKSRRLETEDADESWELVKSPYFRITRTQLTARQTVKKDTDSFHIIFPASGSVIIDSGLSVEVAHGQSCLVPAAITNYTISPRNEVADVICISR